MPPPVFDTFKNTESQGIENNIGVLVETMKGAVRLRGKRRDPKPNTQAATVEDDSDDDGERVFSTDPTYDLMTQLKDVLIMSVAQGWQIFDDGCVTRVSTHFHC